VKSRSSSYTPEASILYCAICPARYESYWWCRSFGLLFMRVGIVEQFPEVSRGLRAGGVLLLRRICPNARAIVARSPEPKNPDTPLASERLRATIFRRASAVILWTMPRFLCWDTGCRTVELVIRTLFPISTALVPLVDDESVQRNDRHSGIYRIMAIPWRPPYSALSRLTVAKHEIQPFRL